MSVVIGIETDGGVFLGADSAVSYPFTVDTGFRKVHLFMSPKTGDVAYGIGAVGSARATQVLEYWLDLEPPEPGCSPERWAVTRLVPALKQLADEHGPWNDGESTDDQSVSKTGFSMLVAVKGQLLNISECYTVTRSPSGYNAIGSGAELALGSLETTQELLGANPELAGALMASNRVHLAISAAAKWSPTVEKPTDIKWVPHAG